MKRSVVLSILLTMVTMNASSADAYFVRFSAVGRAVGSGNIIWADDILFFNAAALFATVRFVSVSNGQARPNPPDLTIPPNQVVALNANGIVNGGWTPVSNPGLWVLHLDIPPGVTVESRDEFYVSVGVPELFPVSRGKVSMPIYRALVPANQRQVHLGTDLGATDSHINVGVYNAGDVPATAVIDVSRTCDNTVVATRTISVPANTVVQTGGLSIGPPEDCTSGLTASWERMVSITVDQPSFTFVSNVNENVQRGPDEAGIVPIVGLAVAKNEQF